MIGGADRINQVPVTIGATQLELEHRNRPLVTQQVITYRLSKRVGPTPKPYITNLSLPFTEEGLAFGPIQLVSPDLGLQLVDNLTPSNAVDDFVDITAEVSFTGEFSADKHPFTTGSLIFPIRAFRSNPMPCACGVLNRAGGLAYDKLHR